MGLLGVGVGVLRSVGVMNEKILCFFKASKAVILLAWKPFFLHLHEEVYLTFTNKTYSK